jgi:hypothetical protein
MTQPPHGIPRTSLYEYTRGISGCSFTQIFQFYTTLSIILVITWPISSLVFDPLLSSFIVLIIGSYIVYFRHRWISVTPSNDCPNGGYIAGLDLQANHMICHVAPFVVAWVIASKWRGYKVPELRHTVLTLVLMAIYISFTDTFSVYRCDKMELLLVGTVALILWLWMLQPRKS